MRLVLVLVVVGSGGCGTDPPSWAVDSGACVAYAVPSTTDLSMPPVSFATDVMPIFNRSCGSSRCHGSTSAPTGNVFLGASTAKGADATMVLANLVAKPSGEMGMMFVAPGNPAASYVMHKLDGDQCALPMSCTGDGCTHSMPSDGSILAVDTRDIVRRWIYQGATAN
jgi:hypothetical protein